MSWVIWVSIITVIVVVLAIVMVASAAWAEGYYSVRKEKRGPLLFCNKHGPISEKATINWLGAESCALCFHERMQQGERGELG